MAENNGNFGLIFLLKKIMGIDDKNETNYKDD